MKLSCIFGHNYKRIEIPEKQCGFLSKNYKDVCICCEKRKNDNDYNDIFIIWAIIILSFVVVIAAALTKWFWIPLLILLSLVTIEAPNNGRGL